MIENIFQSIVIIAVVGTGGTLIAYFRRRDICLKATRDKVDKINKKLDRLIQILFIDYKKNHPDGLEDFRDLLKLINEEEE